MIELKVDGYCQDCPYFEPKTERLYVNSFYDTTVVATNIHCQNRDLCAHLIKHLRKGVKNND